MSFSDNPKQQKTDNGETKIASAASFREKEKEFDDLSKLVIRFFKDEELYWDIPDMHQNEERPLFQRLMRKEFLSGPIAFFAEYREGKRTRTLDEILESARVLYGRIQDMKSKAAQAARQWKKKIDYLNSTYYKTLNIFFATEKQLEKDNNHDHDELLAKADQYLKYAMHMNDLIEETYRYNYYNMNAALNDINYKNSENAIIKARECLDLGMSLPTLDDGANDVSS